MIDRVEIGSWCTLYHVDSTEIVNRLRHHRPDAVIMDPPYGIGFSGVAVCNRGGAGNTLAASERGAGGAVVGDVDGASLDRWFGFPQVLFWGA